ncbi:hypothetical protein [Halorubrum sp. HHNYT27]|uniref:hypothetical protein n=1 Tax=Halorubrum sp. HHNYT27 TaxID=3402275 RepID=UPI003EB7FA2D
MKRQSFDFFGSVLLEVRGDGGRSTQQFYTMFDHFAVDDPEREPDIVVERTTEEPDLEAVLGDPSDYYGWTGDRFVVRNGSNFMMVEPGWDHIYVSPNWEPFLATYPVEFRIRQELAKEGRALIHASGIELDGETTLFPAWRGGGKTNTLLSLLREGAGYLSDDRLWVGTDGTALGYPLSVNLQPYNIRSFPEIEVGNDDLQDYVRDEVSQFIEVNMNASDGVVQKVVSFLNERFLQEKGREFTDVSAVFPGSKHIPESTVDNVVALRAAPNRNHVVIEEMSPEEMVTEVDAISYYEWNEVLMEYFLAYDALCPGPSFADQLDDVIEAEEDALREVFEDVDTYQAWIPRTADWKEDGIDREVVNRIESLSTREQSQTAD